MGFREKSRATIFIWGIVVVVAKVRPPEEFSKSPRKFKRIPELFPWL
jgi:hypothetical protein